MTAAKPEISVIIVSYNVWGFLEPCIKSVIAQKEVQYEVIVVDNNSSDGTVELIRKNFPEVKVIANLHNAGFPAANNQGMEVAAGEYIVLLNPDTVVETDAFMYMLEYIKKQDGPYVILGPRLVNEDGSLQVSCWRFPTVWNMLLETFFLHKIIRPSVYNPAEMASVFRPEYLSGAAMMFDKELIEKIGNMDESLFWIEDVDLCYRNIDAGGKNIYLPDAKVIHYGGKSAVKNYKVVISNQINSKLKFFKKNKNKGVFYFAVVLAFMHLVSRTIVFAVLSPFRQIFSTKCRAYGYAFTKFLRYIFINDESVV